MPFPYKLDQSRVAPTQLLIEKRSRMPVGWLGRAASGGWAGTIISARGNVGGQDSEYAVFRHRSLRDLLDRMTDLHTEVGDTPDTDCWTEVCLGLHDRAVYARAYNRSPRRPAARLFVAYHDSDGRIRVRADGASLPITFDQMDDIDDAIGMLAEASRVLELT